MAKAHKYQATLLKLHRQYRLCMENYKYREQHQNN